MHREGTGVVGRYAGVVGDQFTGYFSNDAGPEIAWTHQGPDFLLEADGAIEVICRLNGGLVADAIGWARVDGRSGYSFAVHVVDNGDPPPGFVPVCARLIQGPPRARHDYVRSFGLPETVIIPEALPVIEGNAGDGSARLRLDGHTCHYSADAAGANYSFDRCTGPGGASYLSPGDPLSVSDVRLRIVRADASAPVTYVEANIGTNLDPWHFRTPDSYQLLLGDEVGAVLYTSSGDLACGDIDFLLFE